MDSLGNNFIVGKYYILPGEEYLPKVQYIGKTDDKTEFMFKWKNRIGESHVEHRPIGWLRNNNRAVPLNSQDETDDEYEEDKYGFDTHDDQKLHYEKYPDADLDLDLDGPNYLFAGPNVDLYGIGKGKGRYRKLKTKKYRKTKTKTKKYRKTKTKKYRKSIR